MVYGDCFGGEKRTWERQNVLNNERFHLSSVFSDIFHDKITENLALYRKAWQSFSISHLADPLMCTTIVTLGDIQIIRRLLFVFKFLLKYLILLAGDFETVFGNV